MRATLLERRTPNAGFAPAGIYDIDPATSSVGFEAQSPTLTHTQGRFMPVNGLVRVAGLPGDRSVALEMHAGNPWDRATPESVAQVDAGAPEPLTAAFIAFRSWSIRVVEQSLVLKGLLTIDRTTYPVVLAARLDDEAREAGQIAFTAVAPLEHETWGEVRESLRPGRSAFEEIRLIACVHADRRVS